MKKKIEFLTKIVQNVFECYHKIEDDYLKKN